MDRDLSLHAAMLRNALVPWQPCSVYTAAAAADRRDLAAQLVRTDRATLVYVPPSMQLTDTQLLTTLWRGLCAKPIAPLRDVSVLRHRVRDALTSCHLLIVHELCFWRVHVVRVLLFLSQSCPILISTTNALWMGVVERLADARTLPIFDLDTGTCLSPLLPLAEDAAATIVALMQMFGSTRPLAVGPRERLTRALCRWEQTIISHQGPVTVPIELCALVVDALLPPERRSASAVTATELALRSFAQRQRERRQIRLWNGAAASATHLAVRATPRSTVDGGNDVPIL